MKKIAKKVILIAAFLVAFINIVTAALTQPGIEVKRYIQGNFVTLTVDQLDLPSDEVLILIEDLPEGVSYVEESASYSPVFPDNTLLIWFFAKSIPQQFGAFMVSDPIPDTITYRTSRAPALDDKFNGVFVLNELSSEGIFIDGDCQPACEGKECGKDGCGGNCGTCSPDYICTIGQCIPGISNIESIMRYKDGEITILALLRAIRDG